MAADSRRGDEDLQRGGPGELTVLAAQAPEVDLDTDLEEQEHHAHVREQLELLPVGHEAGRERRHGDTERQVADDGGKPEASGEPAGRDGGQQQRAELEDGGGGLHVPDGSERWFVSGQRVIPQVPT